MSMIQLLLTKLSTVPLLFPCFESILLTSIYLYIECRKDPPFLFFAKIWLSITCFWLIIAKTLYSLFAPFIDSCLKLVKSIFEVARV